jgi:nitrite reductase/ring-hydroxylating ferredoxin subunit
VKTRDKKLLVCASESLSEKKYIILDLLYQGEPHSGIVLRFNGKVFAYLNRCVHMPRRLNCERDTIFDEQQALLRCSMHGIVYQPETGESLSTMCHGERLRALRLNEADGNIYIDDKRVSPVQGAYGPEGSAGEAAVSD